MHSVSRRSLFRLAGGAVGVTGVAGGLLVPTYGASSKVRVRLNSTVVQSGERLTLHVAENLKQARRIRVKDSRGHTWKQAVKNRRYQRWTAIAREPGNGTLTVVTTRKDGKVFRNKVEYQITETRTGTLTGAAALIGMSAMPDQWDKKVAEVGAGLGARRIFADLGDGPTSQIKLVEEAHAAGLLPVISYKVGGDVAGAMNGALNGVAEQAAAKLASYGLPTAVTIWHEPYKDMSGAEYAAMSKQLLPIFKRGELRVGPILNGWLLDNKLAEFESFCPDELFAIWQYVGIDTYESGTMAAPGPVKPAQRIPALSAYVKSRGYDLPLGVGEYNGYSAETIAAAGEALLSTPNVWFGCLWNVTGGVGVELSGDRLEAFRGTLADPRVGRPRAV